MEKELTKLLRSTYQRISIIHDHSLVDHDYNNLFNKIEELQIAIRNVIKAEGKCNDINRIQQIIYIPTEAIDLGLKHKP